MKWVADNLLEGKPVSFRPSGNSMLPHIKSKQLVTVEPIVDKTTLEVGDIVLSKVSSRYLLHMIHGTKVEGENLSFQIGNAKGYINGWTQTIFGKVVSIA